MLMIPLPGFHLAEVTKDVVVDVRTVITEAQDTTHLLTNKSSQGLAAACHTGTKLTRLHN